MDASEKREFVSELIDNVRRDILAKVDQMPDDWNGIELRQYIADKFSGCVIASTMDRGRKRAYQNTMLTTNL